MADTISSSFNRQPAAAGFLFGTKQRQGKRQPNNGNTRSKKPSIKKERGRELFQLDDIKSHQMLRTPNCPMNLSHDVSPTSSFLKVLDGVSVVYKTMLNGWIDG